MNEEINLKFKSSLVPNTREQFWISNGKFLVSITQVLKRIAGGGKNWMSPSLLTVTSTFSFSSVRKSASVSLKYQRLF